MINSTSFKRRQWEHYIFSCNVRCVSVWDRSPRPVLCQLLHPCLSCVLHFLFLALPPCFLSSLTLSNPLSHIQTKNLALISVPLCFPHPHPVLCLPGLLGGVSAPKLPTSSGLPSGILIGEMRGAALRRTPRRDESGK